MPHDARERALVSRGVAHHPCLIARDDGHASQLARARRSDHALLGGALTEEDRVSSAVDAEHSSHLRVLVRGSPFGARAIRLRVGTGADAALVEVLEVVFEVVGVVQPAHPQSRSILSPEHRELREGLRGGADVVDLDAGDAQADERFRVVAIR